MQTLTQLNPPIPIKTPKGKAVAHILIDYGPEHDLLWVCFQDETGECWTWQNRDIRSQDNITMGREPPLKLTAYDVHEELRKRNAQIAKLELECRDIKNAAYPERKDVHTT